MWFVGDDYSRSPGRKSWNQRPAKFKAAENL